MIPDIVAAYVLAGFAFVLLIHSAIEAIETPYPVAVRLAVVFVWPVFAALILIALLMFVVRPR